MRVNFVFIERGLPYMSIAVCDRVSNFVEVLIYDTMIMLYVALLKITN